MKTNEFEKMPDVSIEDKKKFEMLKEQTIVLQEKMATIQEFQDNVKHTFENIEENTKVHMKLNWISEMSDNFQSIAKRVNIQQTELKTVVQLNQTIRNKIKYKLQLSGNRIEYDILE